MVIQRLQSLYLLLACALMCVLCFCIPIGTLGGACVYASAQPSMMVILLITAVLQFVDIFLFNNLKFQMKVTLACGVLVWASMLVCSLVMLMRMPEGFKACWAWPSIAALASFVLTIMAYSGMKADYRKLRSYDRLW